MAIFDKKIALQLQKLFRERDGMTIDYVWFAIGKKLSRDTIDRAKKGEGKLRERTAYILADFIEKETDGNCLAKGILDGGQKDFRGANLGETTFRESDDLLGAEFTDAKLNGAIFKDIDLGGAKFIGAILDGAIFDGVYGEGTKLIAATLNGAVIKNFKAEHWDMTGVTMESGEITKGLLRARLLGANLSGAKLRNIEWRSGGSACGGLRLPNKIDFSGFKWGAMNHLIVAKLISQAFSNHPKSKKFESISQYILAQQYAPVQYEYGLQTGYCNLVNHVQAEYPELERELLTTFQSFPAMGIFEQYKLAETIIGL